jgi:hypothetical protein
MIFKKTNNLIVTKNNRKGEFNQTLKYKDSILDFLNPKD